MALIDIEPMTAAHVDRMEEIERLSFSVPWSRELLEAELTNPYVFYLVALSEGDVAGYIGIESVLDEGRVLNIAVHPIYRRRGIGCALMSAALEICGGLESLTLEVRESNSPAIALYSGFGFKPVGKRRSYYEKPTEDALLMTLAFNKHKS